MHGAAGEVVRMIFREELVPLMDLKLGLEYQDVALRSEHVRASALSKREILELIEAVVAFAEPVEVVTKTRPMSPDPSGDMVLGVAINGRAEALVTSNTKHFARAGEEVWNTCAFSGGTVRENEKGEPRWRLNRARPRSRSFRCG
jgi:predicted nucleic acid-binding protein